MREYYIPIIMAAEKTEGIRYMVELSRLTPQPSYEEAQLVAEDEVCIRSRAHNSLRYGYRIEKVTVL